MEFFEFWLGRKARCEDDSSKSVSGLYQILNVICGSAKSNAYYPSIRSHSLKRPRPTPVMKRSIVRITLHHAINPWAINPPAKHQHNARLRLNHEVLHINRALHPTRLVRPLEVPADHRPFLSSSRYFVEVDPFGSLQYKVHLPAAFAGCCCGGGCWPHTSPTDTITKAKQATTTLKPYLFTTSSTHNPAAKKSTAISRLFHLLQRISVAR